MKRSKTRAACSAVIPGPLSANALARDRGADGIAAVTLWRIRERMAARLTLTAMLAVTAAWAWVLLGRSPGWYPWLRVVVVVLATLGAAGFIISRREVGSRRARERGYNLTSPVSS